jgi:hypothetical protein
MYAPEAATGLCATCSWGTVRKRFRPAEAETFYGFVTELQLAEEAEVRTVPAGESERSNSK